MNEPNESLMDKVEECKMKVPMNADRMTVVQEYARCRLDLEKSKRKEGLSVEEIDKINDQLRLLRNEFFKRLENFGISVKLKKVDETNKLVVEYNIKAEDGFRTNESYAEGGFVVGNLKCKNDVIQLPGNVEEKKCSCKSSVPIANFLVKDQYLNSRNQACGVSADTQVIFENAEFYEPAEACEAKSKVAELDTDFYQDCDCLKAGIIIPEDSISLNLIRINENYVFKMPVTDRSDLLNNKNLTGTNENLALKASDICDANDNQNLRDDLKFVNDEDDDNPVDSPKCSLFGFDFFCF